MIQYSLVTEQPDNEPVSLNEVKTHLEYTGTAKDSYIYSLITTARKICEAYSGLSFVTQVRGVQLDRFPTRIYIELPYGPVQSIESFTYENNEGDTVELIEDEDFRVDYHSRVARVYPIGDDGQIDSWPTDIGDILSPIQIDYQTGFDDASGEMTPAQVKQAIFLQVASMFENRQDEQAGNTSMINWNSMAILDTIKVTWNANLD